VKAAREPQFAEQVKSLGLDLVGSSRAELDAFRRAQRKQINEIVKASGVDVK
jgi:tripartite-type tricarboxylate transporter receptor subunit TctC